MYAGNSAADNINRFQFVYNIAKCCFGGPPKIQHFVHCKVLPKHTVDSFGGALVKTVGTLHVRVERDPGTDYITGIYFMDVESVDLVD